MSIDKMQAIKQLLYPKSVAVIGASNNPKKTGGRLISYLTMHDYANTIYPVNPKESIVQGRPCYHSIQELPDNIDLALVILPVQHVLKAMEDCASKGIKVLAIYSSGFAELGKEGELIQEQLVKKARKLNLFICGPNMIGIVNTHQNFFGSFSMSVETPNIPKHGKIAFISQSGAIGGGLLSRLWTEGIGISHFISSGNEADLDSSDFISYLASDVNTDIICVYLEGIRDGQKFIKALKTAQGSGKPVIIYKNGRTSLGKKSVQSHTGSLAGDFLVYEAVFKQYGVISVDQLEEMFEVAKALLVVHNISGKNVAVISTSGGACTIIADSCIKHGLNLPAFSEQTQERLGNILPDFGAVQNPFDTTASIINSPENLKRSLEIVLCDPGIDSIILMLTTVGDPIASEIAKDIIDLSNSLEKSIILTWLISETLAKDAFDLLRQNQIPIFSSPERASAVLKYVTDYYLKKKVSV